SVRRRTFAPRGGGPKGAIVMRRLVILLALVLAMAIAPARADAALQRVSITSCGVTVPALAVGVLGADIACNDQGNPASPYFGITLLPGARLLMRGHTITYVQGSVNPQTLGVVE